MGFFDRFRGGHKEREEAIARELERARKFAWEKKHYARTPFFGKLSDAKGWGAHGERLMDPKVRSTINTGRKRLRERASKIAEERGKTWKGE